MKALVISPVITHPVRSAPALRVRQSMELLQEIADTVDLLYIGMQGPAPKAMQEHWGSRLQVVPYQSPAVHGGWSQRQGYRLRKWLPQQLGGLKHNLPLDGWEDHVATPRIQNIITDNGYDLVYLHYVFISYCLRDLPEGVSKVLDTHDIFTDRYKMFEAQGQVNDWYSTSESEEITGWSRAQLITTVSESDQRYIVARVDRPVITYGQLYTTVTAYPLPDTLDTLLFVGNANMSNEQGMRAFIDKVWPHLRSNYPELKLNVVGRVCEGLQTAAGIELLGTVDDLDEYYNKAAVVINPVQSGTGMAFKCLEALAHGRPVIATPCGARGFDEATEVVKVAESVEGWISSLRAIVQDRAVAETLSVKATAFIEAWNLRHHQAFIQGIQNLVSSTV